MSSESIFAHPVRTVGVRVRTGAHADPRGEVSSLIQRYRSAHSDVDFHSFRRAATGAIGRAHTMTVNTVSTLSVGSPVNAAKVAKAQKSIRNRGGVPRQGMTSHTEV